MEEDIKILESYIEKINEGYCKDCNELCNMYGVPVEPPIRIAEAIQNLIARYKELKEAEEIERHNYQVAINETVPIYKVKSVLFDIEQALSFARTGRYRRDKIQCEILENVRDKLYKEFFED